MIVGAAPWPLAIAFAAGLAMSHFALARMHAETRLLAAAAVLLIAVRELDPFHFSDVAGEFYWIAFSGLLQLVPVFAISVLSGKFFLYVASGGLVRSSVIS